MLAVWLAVTASAVTVAWFGIDSVVGAQASVFPQLLTPVDASGAAGPVLGAGTGGEGQTGAGQTGAGGPSSAVPTPDQGSTPTPGRGSSSPAVPPSGSPTEPAAQVPAAPPAAPSSADGQVRRFSMVGGVVVAQFDGDTVNFVSASPNSGYRMQDWIETGQEWLRVDFTESADDDIVYSLFITWNGYSPQWTEAGPDGTQNGS